MDNNVYAENNCVNGNTDTFQDNIENFDSSYANRNENGFTSEFIEDYSNVLENSDLKENETISDIHNSNNENNKLSNLNFLQKNENISLQIIINQKAQFEEQFIDLKSDLTITPELRNIQKKLTIPCMTALDYFKRIEMEGENKTDENFKLSSSSKEINFNTGSLCTEKISTPQNELIEAEFANGSNNTKYAKENQIKLSTFHKEITCNKEIPKNKDSNSSLAEIETNNDLDKIGHNLYSSDKINAVSSTNIFKTENIRDIGSCLLNEEEFIAEKITFREKEESDDNDVIPTGVFTHLMKYLNIIMKRLPSI
ncbi:hypothetical protein HNY73_000385 [Argiope bruennichi]|uniref:Uncharacterized protein n=1 Tax=Argiope bruennichi TaxID=94029 RepID=A0A8T0FY17_ARGBR|nr:hypothetical protein HNY73_000385 [Argiope bruennichi]